MTATRPLRVVQVSDSHLAPGLPSADDNWTAVVEHLAADPPDLVVHTGDVTLDGAHDDDHLDHARRRLDALPCTWRAIPGNHDIGDFPPTTMPLRAHRRTAFEQRFGAADWTIDLGAWRIVGIDVQTLVVDGADGDRWQWLEVALDTAGPTMFCCHRPLWPPAGADDKAERYVPEPTRSRLLELLAAHDVEVIASGHVHQRGTFTRDGLRAEWGPATWGVVPDHVQPVIADKRVGIVEYELGDEVVSRMVVPSGARQLTIGIDFPNPYDH